MTNEQRVRVDRLERYLITDREKTYTTVRVNDLDTALSLIKEQQEEIEKKDKQIDLMADKLVEAHEWFYSGFDNFTKEDFIQYFERKVEDVKD